MPPKANALDRLLKNMRKQFGPEAIQCLTDNAGARVPTFPSGSIAFDRALGGGLPEGRIVEVFGHESSGKTTLCLHALREMQRAGRTCAIVDAEHALDPSYAARIGVDLDRLLVSQPDCGEQGLCIAEGLIASGEVGLVVVDSVAALTPRAEIEGDIGDTHVGLQARLMSQALRKLTALCHRHRTTLIFTNQIRQKVGVVFGSPETTPGGNALKFFASVRVRTARASTARRGDEPTGTEIRARVVKNKIAPPFREARMTLDYGAGIRREHEAITLGTELGVLDKAGSWLAFEGNRLGNGKDAAAAHLAAHPDLCDAIIAALPAPTGYGPPAAAPPPTSADPASTASDPAGGPPQPGLAIAG